MSRHNFSDAIVFTLNNTDIHHIYSAMTLHSIELMLNYESESAIRFFNNSAFFDLNSFNLLKDVVSNEGNTRVEMNLQQLIVYFASVDFVCRMIIEDDEIFNKIITDADNEDQEIIKSKFLAFGSVATKKIKTDFKDNINFMYAVKQITS